VSLFHLLYNKKYKDTNRGLQKLRKKEENWDLFGSLCIFGDLVINIEIRMLAMVATSAPSPFAINPPILILVNWIKF